MKRIALTLIGISALALGACGEGTQDSLTGGRGGSSDPYATAGGEDNTANHNNNPGAADPAAALRLQPIGGFTWSQLHLAGALAGLAFIGWCFYRQWINLVANQEIINQVQAEVRRIRLEKGLEV